MSMLEDRLRYIKVSESAQDTDQQVKIKCFSDGDKNTAFFHSTLKARRHKNRIETICDENGDSFEGEMVA
ncbi:hypothetical protein Tco_0091011, partial [Tanacetum coccineum]